MCVCVHTPCVYLDVTSSTRCNWRLSLHPLTNFNNKIMIISLLLSKMNSRGYVYIEDHRHFYFVLVVYTIYLNWIDGYEMFITQGYVQMNIIYSWHRRTSPLFSCVNMLLYIYINWIDGYEILITRGYVWMNIIHTHDMPCMNRWRYHMYGVSIW